MRHLARLRQLINYCQKHDPDTSHESEYKATLMDLENFDITSIGPDAELETTQILSVHLSWLSALPASKRVVLRHMLRSLQATPPTVQTKHILLVEEESPPLQDKLFKQEFEAITDKQRLLFSCVISEHRDAIAMWQVSVLLSQSSIHICPIPPLREILRRNIWVFRKADVLESMNVFQIKDLGKYMVTRWIMSTNMYMIQA